MATGLHPGLAGALPAVVGRFAPSPTGPLHFGSLLTALASCCDARASGGRWLVRIEDTDQPRCVPTATAAILEALAGFGLHADGQVVFQHARVPLYEAALARLHQAGLVYGCACSRKQLDPSRPYPGHCRHKNLPLDGHTVRLRVPDRELTFVDRLQGRWHENLTHTTGDCVLRRRDGIVSYQLAVVVDDADQGITDVVRGADLLDNTPRQIWLAHCLNVPVPRYLHLPLAMNAQGQKLSKQNLAAPLQVQQAPVLMRAALLALGQPDPGLGTPDELLTRAVRNWRPDRIAPVLTLPGHHA